jgi:hypothetical protein
LPSLTAQNSEIKIKTPPYALSFQNQLVGTLARCTPFTSLCNFCFYLILNNVYPSLRKDKHILFPYIQHIPHLRPGANQNLQFLRFDGDFPFDALPDLGDAAALVVEEINIR